MGWVRRGNCRFYLRSVRRGGRVLHEYHGSGPAAELAAELDARRREERFRERADRAAAAAAWVTADGPLAELIGLSDLPAEAALLTAGFHRHHLGEWRRCRERGD